MLVLVLTYRCLLSTMSLCCVAQAEAMLEVRMGRAWVLSLLLPEVSLALMLWQTAMVSRHAKARNALRNALQRPPEDTP